MVAKKTAKKTRQTKKPKIKKSKLSIAHMHWGYPPIIGGVETHLITVMPEMARKGHKVSLLTGAFEGKKSYYMEDGCHIFRTPIMDLNWLNKRGVQCIRKGNQKSFYRLY